jgi:hypothetical protein
VSLTGANSVIILSIPNLFATPVVLQGYAADDIFDVDQVRRAETLMGVDGFLSAGFIWEQVKQTYAFQADSDSNLIFDQWQMAEQAISDKYPCTATITLPGILAQFNCGPGYLTMASPIPGAKKLYQPRRYTIEWQQVLPAEIATVVQTLL